MEKKGALSDIRPVRRTREETQDCILKKADELFRQYGYGKTTVADIARELGMSPANIYKFFPSKNALIQACAARNLVTLKVAIEGIFTSARSALKRIEAITLAIFSFNKDLLRNEKQLFQLVAAASEENWGCVCEFKKMLHQMMKSLIQEGMRTGEFAKGNANAWATALLDSLALVIHPDLRRMYHHDESEKRVRFHIQFLIRALR